MSLNLTRRYKKKKQSSNKDNTQSYTKDNNTKNTVPAETATTKVVPNNTQLRRVQTIAAKETKS